MNYNIKKYVTSALIIIILFSILWYMQNDKAFISSIRGNILLFMNGSLQGYSSQKVLVILTLFFLLFMNVHAIKESPSYLTRKADRTKIFNDRFINIFFSSILFVTSYQIVNILFTFIFLGNEIMSTTNFYLITLLNAIALIFFYCWVGLLNKLIEDWSNSRNITVVTTFVVVVISYYLETAFWVPIKDMRVYEGLLSGEWDLTDVCFVYIRQLGLVIVFYILGKMIFYDKDFIIYEK
ncbi:WxPxxD family membrane protein [Cytobacillus firmus]|uniref:WxPxxD family membrane protein n=1 Tax=Cytobacillus firmus TaxID=1399 RepID=UPI0036AF8ACB